MCVEPFHWVIFPMLFFGMMILFMIFSRRRGRWSCCSWPDDRGYRDDRIRKLEEEVERLRKRG